MTRAFRFGIQAGGPADPEGWTDLARQVEDLGYSSLSMADHFSNEMAPMPALAAAAAATTTLRVGTMVACNDFRHPAVLAFDAGTVDLLSDGRLELGVGAGWMLTDYEQTGIPLDSPGTRIQRLEEAVAVLKGWFSGEEFSFDGDFYTIAGLTGTASVQRPHPPILMGGGAPRMLRTAGRCADIIGLNPNLNAGVIDSRAGASATMAASLEKLEWIKEGAGDRFESIELQSRIHLAAITDDSRGMAEMLAPALGISTDEALASPHALGGTVDELVDKIGRLRDTLGITYFTLSADAIEPFAPIVAQLTR